MKLLEEYTSEEIFDKFTELYNLAKSNYNTAKDTGYEKKDIEHWCFEAIMELLGKDIWKEYNNFL